MTLKKVINIFDPVINDFKDPMFRVKLKCKDHPTILAIQNKWKNDNKSVFEETNLASIKKQIHNVKENIDIFAEFLWTSISSSIKSSTFPSCLKSADVTHLHEKVIKDKKGNYSPVSILQLYLNVLKNAYLGRCLPVSMKYFQNINMVLERGIVLNNVF